ncbi:MAG: hypothetical protein ACFFDN_00295 [Candidatus Hodarchaeota archaeon]
MYKKQKKGSEIKMKNQFNFQDDIQKLESKIESLKPYKSRMKTKFKQLIHRYEKCGLEPVYFIEIVEEIDAFYSSLENNIKDAITYIKEEIENYGKYYGYNEDELIKKGDYPRIWLFHGGFLGGRAVIIKPNQHSEKMYPILLEDFNKLEEIKNERKLTREDVNPSIEKFKSLNFYQKQENLTNCYNEHLKFDTERRLKIFEERIINTEKKLASIDRDPSRERHLKETLTNTREYKKQCIETLEKLKNIA